MVSVFAGDITRALPPMTDEAMAKQPSAVWRAVERRIIGPWTGRVRYVTGTEAGTSIAPGWLNWRTIPTLLALDVPVRHLFTACALMGRADNG